MTYENLILKQLEHMDLNALLELGNLIREQTGFSDLAGFRDFILEIAKGEISLELHSILNFVIPFFFQEIQACLTGCGSILILCILSGLLNNISGSFGTHTVSKTANLICLILVITTCIEQFISIYSYCDQQLDLMILSIQSLFPVMVPLLLASGKAVSGTLLNPAILSVITMIGTVIENWILPAIFYSCIFVLIGHMTGQSFLNRTGKLLNDIIVFSVGFTVTIVSAFTTIQGAVGKTADSLILKTARFSVDNFIPLIGGFAADSMDMVLHCTSVIKNAIGLWGLLVLLVLLLFPLIKLAAMILIWRICSVFVEAITERRIASCLDGIASTVTTLAVIYTLMGILFIVFLSILIAVV